MKNKKSHDNWYSIRGMKNLCTNSTTLSNKRNYKKRRLAKNFQIDNSRTLYSFLKQPRKHAN